MRFFLLAALVFFPILSCSPDKESDNLHLRDTVTAYLRMLAEGYREMNMAPLAQIATPRRTARAYHHMAALGEGQVRMDMQLVKIAFLDFSRVDQVKAEVKTRENWYAQYFNIDTGKKVSDNTVQYIVRYHMVNEKGRWLVDEIDVLESSETNENSGLNFYRRPPGEPPGSPARSVEEER